jgi:protein-disulfide isomerase
VRVGVAFLVAAGVISATLSACSATGPDAAGALGGAAPVTDTASAFAAVAGKEPTTPRNPLATPPSKAPGGREVIKNPTLADVLQTGDLPEFSLGTADAPVTVIKYASLTCPYCKQFQRTTFPELKRTLIDTGKVRFIIREFPIGRSSGNATIALRCAPMDKYLTLYNKFLEQQATWVSQDVRLDKIFSVAQQVGMKRSEFDACLKNQGMISSLQWVKDRGRKLGIIGTPNFFIQNKLYKKQLSLSEIREAVETSTKTANATAN